MTESDLFRWWRETWASTFQMKRIVTVDQDTDPNDTYEDDHRVARLEGFGDIVCPPAGEFGVLWLGGHGGVGFPLSSPTYKPKTQNGDGTCYVGRGLYCEVPGVSVLLHGQNSTTPGKLELNSGGKVGAPQDVVVNAGTQPVARKTDLVKAATQMAKFMTDVATFINGIAPGSVVVPLDFGEISTGAPHFKG